MMTHGGKLIKSERCSVFVVDREGKEVWTKFAEGLEDKSDIIRLPWDKGIVGEAVKTRKMVLVKDAYESESFDRVRGGFRPISTPEWKRTLALDARLDVRPK